MHKERVIINRELKAETQLSSGCRSVIVHATGCFLMPQCEPQAQRSADPHFSATFIARYLKGTTRRQAALDKGNLDAVWNVLKL
jgi:hypothetical protein